MSVSGMYIPLLTRIAEALERLSPAPAIVVDFEDADIFLWQGFNQRFFPIASVCAPPLSLLTGIDQQRDRLYSNTERFVLGYPANNALLWGARGAGKSSLVKAVYVAIEARWPGAVAMVELPRDHLASLPLLLELLRHSSRRFLIFCDDLSFTKDDIAYNSLKAVLDGGVAGRPDNVIFYATSNRRHLIPRDMIENEQQIGIHPGEAVEENVSLSDRFGLWLGFHACDHDDYLAMVRSYARAYGLPLEDGDLIARALEWARTRGNRSGRSALQCVEDIAGDLGCSQLTIRPDFRVEKRNLKTTADIADVLNKIAPKQLSSSWQSFLPLSAVSLYDAGDSEGNHSLGVMLIRKDRACAEAFLFMLPRESHNNCGTLFLLHNGERLARRWQSLRIRINVISSCCDLLASLILKQGYQSDYNRVSEIEDKETPFFIKPLLL